MKQPSPTCECYPPNAVLSQEQANAVAAVFQREYEENPAVRAIVDAEAAKRVAAKRSAA